MGKTVRPSDERLSDIAELAEGIAEESFPNRAVEPESIIRRKKITLSRGSYGNSFDGMLEHRSGQFHIYCNVARVQNSARIRFTLSHELGHYFIDDHRQALEAGLPPHPSFSEYQSDNPAEQEADHFASNLLMPRARFVRVAERLPVGAPAILSLAEEFDTSRTSTALRYTHLDISLCALIKWNPDGSSWRRFSDSAFRAGYRKIVDVAAEVPPDSPTGKALRGLDPGPEPFFEGTTVASQWFPFIQQGTRLDVFTTEHAVPLGEYGALTVVVPNVGDGDLHPARWK
jgi:Zn-dependent peptidase ImmA (M78 family)